MSHELQDLLFKYFSEDLNFDEKKHLLVLLNEAEGQEEFSGVLKQMFDTQLEEKYYSAATDKRIRSRVSQLIKESNTTRQMYPMRKWWWAAAAVLLSMVIGAYVWNQQKLRPQQQAQQTALRDVLPGKNGAVLTLADGRQVVLDSLGNGVISTQNGAKVVLQKGQLAYQPTARSTEEVTYNTMSTPQGRQFHLVLPDHTGIWLNAASSITYPTSFTGKERKVEITGEVYFEVAKNEKMPFVVAVSPQTEIHVLGTSFNINAYADEKSMKTTLLEGKIKQKGMYREVILQSGQQLQVNQQKVFIDNNADLRQVMAWKSGFFSFKNAALPEVMRQISRWYNVEIVYENDKIPVMTFGGEIGRELLLTQVLRILEKSGVHFKILTNNRILVLT